MTSIEYHVLSPLYFLFRDKDETEDIEGIEKRVRFHIETGDYFAMLATALGFVEEALQNTETTAESAELALLRNLKKGLIFLDHRYEIREKTEEKTARGRIE